VAFISGYLGLGTAVVSGVIIEPSSGAGYTRQPISFDKVVGGVTLNVVNGVFGPVTDSWGTLSLFQVFDGFGNPAFAPGTLQSPSTPPVGSMLYVPVGQISLTINAQLADFSTSGVFQPTIVMPPNTVLANVTSGSAGPQPISIGTGLAFSGTTLETSGVMLT
jgi:hypothetical protein